VSDTGSCEGSEPLGKNNFSVRFSMSYLTVGCLLFTLNKAVYSGMYVYHIAVAVL